MNTAGVPTDRSAPSFDDDMLIGDGRAVEFYRADASVRITTIVLLCPIPVAIGLFVIAKPMHSAMEPWAAWLLGITGLLFVIAGPLAMVLNLKRSLQAERYLLVRTDGVLERCGPDAVLHRWEDIEAVVYDGSSKEVILQYRDEDPVRLTNRYAGIDPRNLARRLDEVRRKSLFNLI